MKYAWLVVVLFVSLLFTSCSEIKEDHTLVSYQMDKPNPGIIPNYDLPFLTKFSPVPVKEWKLTTDIEGIEIVMGNNMQNYDYIFAIIEQSEFENSQLMFLQKVDDAFFLPGVSNSEIKDIRVFGIQSSAEIGNYPYCLHKCFSNLKVENWAEGGSEIKVVASEWNNGDKDLFAEVYSDRDRLLVYVGNPGSKEFELPTFKIENVSGVNLFATRRSSELPLDRKR